MRLKAKIVKFNNYEYPTGCVQDIECPVVAVGTFWYTPQYNNDGTWAGWQKTTAVDNTPPTTDSFKVGIVDGPGGRYHVVLTNITTVTAVTDGCLVCCGGSPVDLSANTIPAPIAEVKPCTDAAGARKLHVGYPDTTPLVLSGTFDQVAGTPAPAANYASAATLFTFLTGSWGAYGTWTHNVTDKIITLTLAGGVTSAGVKIV